MLHGDQQQLTRCTFALELGFDREFAQPIGLRLLEKTADTHQAALVKRAKVQSGQIILQDHVCFGQVGPHHTVPDINRVLRTDAFDFEQGDSNTTGLLSLPCR